MPTSFVNTPHATLPRPTGSVAATRLQESVSTASRLLLHPYAMRTRGTPVCVFIGDAASHTVRKRERI